MRKKITVILGHPDEKSFNHAIFRAVGGVLAHNGHTVHAHDLYAEKFDPVLTGREIAADMPDDELTKSYCREITESDGMIFIHPNWWGQPPAILKGYIDRVIRPAVGYEFNGGDSGGGVPRGLFKGKTGIVFNTSDTAGEREEKVFGDPLERIWKNCIFGFCGMTSYYRKMYRIVADSTPGERRQWLKEIEETVGRYFP